MSEVTKVLSGLLNLKRNTAYLLDSLAVSSSLSASRQPQKAVRLEVEIVGNTVSSGLVNIFTSAGAGVASYVVQDRSLATKWAISITDGVISIVATSDAASSEPIVEDNLTAGQYWKILVDNGMIGVEDVATVQDDDVLLNDTVTNTTYQLIVSDGMIGISVFGTTSEAFNFSTNDVKFGSVNFTQIDGITISGITDGFISIRAINKVGQPVNQLILAASSVPVKFYRKKNRIRMEKAGQEKIGEYKLMAEPTLDIRENDLVYPLAGIVGVTVGMVTGVDKIFDFAGLTHHTEAEFMDV